MYWFILAQEEAAASTAMGIGDWIIRGGVPTVLLFFLAVLLYALKKLFDKNEELRAENVQLHKDFTSKVEQLMERIVETNGQLVLALEKSAQSTAVIEAAIRSNEDLLTRYRAELRAAKGGNG